MVRAIRGLTYPHTGGLTSAARLVSTGAGLLLIGAGLIHVSAAADHGNLPVMVAGFLIVACLQVGLGGLLIARRPGRLLIAALVAMTAASIGVWVVSRTAGLPFLADGHMEAIGFKDGVTVLFEIAALPALLLLASRELPAVTLPTPRLGSQALGLLGAGMFALFVPAIMLGGGEHHSREQMEAMGHSHGEGGQGEREELASNSGSGHSHGAGDHSKPGDDPGTADGAGHSTAAAGDGAGGAHPHGGKGKLAAGLLPGDPADGHGHGDGGGDGADRHAPGKGAPGDVHRKEGSGHNDGKGRGRSHDQEGDGHRDGGDGHAGGGHGQPQAGAAGHGEDHGDEQPDQSGQWSGTWEPGRPASGGKPARGAAMVFRTPGDEQTNGPGHDHSGSCNPTTQQRAAADDLYRRTRTALRKYENNPAQAYADGFWYHFGPTDRMIHMVNPDRMRDPTILDPDQIESFIYVMTDDGYMPVGGMYIMPEYGMRGPQPGGCITRWHHHGGLIGLAASSGTMTRTPEMLHVWIYRGLEPYAHYDGREMSQLWTPGSYAPSVCREAGDAMDGCLP